MCLSSLAINQNIVKEEKHKVAQKGLKRFVHEALRSGWCILQRSKGIAKNL
jgi:hypothetical protein